MSKQSNTVIGMVVVAVVVIGGIAFAGHKSSNTSGSTTSKAATSTSSSTTSSQANAVATDTVSISNFKFGPVAITVKKGTKVTWTNQDGVAHTVTKDSGSSGPDSGNMANGATYSYTFDQAGTFAYHCEIHPDMKATVVVTE